MKVSSLFVLLFLSSLSFTDYTEVKPVKAKLMKQTTFERDLLGHARKLTIR